MNLETKHYTKVDSINSWQGGNGESIRSIIDGINAYTTDHAELIVLNLAHDLDTDLGNSSYAPFSQQQWNDLLTLMLEGLRDLFVCDLGSIADLTSLPLKSFIGGEHAAVVIIIDPSRNDISMGSYVGQGFCPASVFPVYNEYSNTNMLDRMTTDQLEKMTAQRTSLNAPCFLLSWTLTQDKLQQLTCIPGLSPSILDLAHRANAVLRDRLLPACSARCFPNILYVDGIDASLDLPGLATEINLLQNASTAIANVAIPRTNESGTSGASR